MKVFVSYLYRYHELGAVSQANTIVEMEGPVDTEAALADLTGLVSRPYCEAYPDAVVVVTFWRELSA